MELLDLSLACIHLCLQALVHHLPLLWVASRVTTTAQHHLWTRTPTTRVLILPSTNTKAMLNNPTLSKHLPMLHTNNNTLNILRSNKLLALLIYNNNPIRNNLSNTPPLHSKTLSRLLNITNRTRSPLPLNP